MRGMWQLFAVTSKGANIGIRAITESNHFTEGMVTYFTK